MKKLKYLLFLTGLIPFGIKAQLVDKTPTAVPMRQVFIRRNLMKTQPLVASTVMLPELLLILLIMYKVLYKEIVKNRIAIFH